MTLHAVSGGEFFHGCRVYNSTTQSIPNSADTLATFDSEDFDTDGYHSTLSNTSRITIPSGLAGFYAIGWIISWADDVDGIRYSRMLKNGVSVISSSAVQFPTDTTGVSSQTPTNNFSTVLKLAAADYIEVNLFHSAGAALNTGSATDYVRNGFWAYFLGV